jgi:hypothetical protein
MRTYSWATCLPEVVGAGVVGVAVVGVAVVATTVGAGVVGLGIPVFTAHERSMSKR